MQPLPNPPNSLTSIALCLLLSLAGCGGDDTSSSPSDHPADAGADTVTSEAAPDVTSDRGDSGGSTGDAGVEAAADQDSPALDAASESGVEAGPTKPKDVWDQIIPPGFVTSADVGLPAGWTPAQTIAGDHASSQDGEVIEDLYIEGMLRVTHDDVIVRNNRVHGGTHYVIQVTGSGVVIENNHLGLDHQEALLTEDVTPGDGDTIKVDTAIPVGATVLLSASTPHQEQFIVVDSSGSGPYTLRLEHRQGDKDIRTPADPDVLHPSGDTIAWYDPATAPALPGNGVAGSGLDYTVRRNLIQAVNDGLKQANGLTVDNLIRLQFYIPPAHLDGIQTMQGNGGRVYHNTILRTQDSNAVLQSGESKGPIVGLEWKWNLHVGGQYFSVRWYGTSADFHWNRWLPGGSKPFLGGGEDLSTRDLRYTDGTLIETVDFGGGPDSVGDGSGAGDAWGSGYGQDPGWQDHFALPGNPEYL